MNWLCTYIAYIALRRNYHQDDARRNRALVALAEETGAPIVAINDVRHHSAERYRLYCAIVDAHRNLTPDEALPHIHPNNHLRLKSHQRCKGYSANAPKP